MKRIFDLSSSIILSIILLIPIIIIAICVRLTSKGPVIYWSDRIGKNNIVFQMPKFRSMNVDTPTIATHLIMDHNLILTPIGSFLRRTSLDELPQLFSVIEGNMSFVGPRPALYNQNDLIELRVNKGVDALMPGVTGWAQINGRDQLTINEKVALDVEYMNRQSFWFDLKILVKTLLNVIKGSNISH